MTISAILDAFSGSIHFDFAPNGLFCVPGILFWGYLRELNPFVRFDWKNVNNTAIFGFLAAILNCDVIGSSNMDSDDFSSQFLIKLTIVSVPFHGLGASIRELLKLIPYSAAILNDDVISRLLTWIRKITLTFYHQGTTPYWSHMGDLGEVSSPRAVGQAPY